MAVNVLILDLCFETADVNINVYESNGSRLCPKLLIFVKAILLCFCRSEISDRAILSQDLIASYYIMILSRPLATSY